MPILQIEHEIQNYEGWKKAFDADPINRKQSGVKKYSIYKPVDDGGSVIVNLEFDNMDDLNKTLTALRNLWNKVQGTVITNPNTRIIEVIESKVV